MAEDGRLTVRFGELRPAVDKAAQDAGRDSSEWVRLQIQKILSEKKRRRAKTEVVAAH